MRLRAKHATDDAAASEASVAERRNIVSLISLRRCISFLPSEARPGRSVYTVK